MSIQSSYFCICVIFNIFLYIFESNWKCIHVCTTAESWLSCQEGMSSVEMKGREQCDLPSAPNVDETEAV